jgi:hypothetical protein
MLSAEDTAEGVGRKKKNSGNQHLTTCSLQVLIKNLAIHPLFA